MRWLYRCEAKSIQAYILGTEKLSEMVGASALIESISDEVRKKAEMVNGKILMGAAGSVTIEFPDNKSLEQFAATWPMRCSRKFQNCHL